MNWNYIHIDTDEDMMMSGWKLYLYGNNIQQAGKLAELILPVSKKYNITTKVATPDIIRRNIRKDIPWSVVVIYLKPDINTQPLIEDIQLALKDYPDSGYIKGAKSIDGKLHYRYDLIIPVEGVPYHEYLELYRGEYGGHNIPNNKEFAYARTT